MNNTTYGPNPEQTQYFGVVLSLFLARFEFHFPVTVLSSANPLFPRHTIERRAAVNASGDFLLPALTPNQDPHTTHLPLIRKNHRQIRCQIRRRGKADEALATDADADARRAVTRDTGRERDRGGDRDGDDQIATFWWALF